MDNAYYSSTSTTRTRTRYDFGKDHSRNSKA